VARALPAVPEGLRELLAYGGNEGWLKHWWSAHGAAT
jgi:3-isopropylmalate/(R)-2-methylmalate dehydratase small subunit